MKNKRNIRERNNYKFCAKMRIDYRLKAQLRNAIVRGSGGKAFEDRLKYTIEEFKQRMEDLFLPGMTWDNYGEWHIDHITPKKCFDYDYFESRLVDVCWGLNNLQPLWADDNMKKGCNCG